MTQLIKYIVFFLASVYIGIVFADTGQYKQRAVIEDPEQSIQTDTSQVLQQQRSIQEYLNVISKLESEHGAFDSRIGESLLSIGKLYRVQGAVPLCEMSTVSSVLPRSPRPDNSASLMSWMGLKRRGENR